MTLTERLSAIETRVKAATDQPVAEAIACLICDEATALDILKTNAPADLTFLTAALREALEALEYVREWEQSDEYVTTTYAMAKDALDRIQRLAGE